MTHRVQAEYIGAVRKQDIAASEGRKGRSSTSYATRAAGIAKRRFGAWPRPQRPPRQLVAKRRIDATVTLCRRRADA